jgi:hypothetical protein
LMSGVTVLAGCRQLATALPCSKNYVQDVSETGLCPCCQEID